MWRNWQKSINTHHITCPQKNSLQNWIFARLPSVPVIKNIFEIIYVNEKSLLSLTPNFPLCRRDYLPAWVVIIISGRYVFLCCWRIYCRFAKSPTQIDIQRIQLQLIQYLNEAARIVDSVSLNEYISSRNQRTKCVNRIFNDQSFREKWRIWVKLLKINDG